MTGKRYPELDSKLIEAICKDIDCSSCKTKTECKVDAIRNVILEWHRNELHEIVDIIRNKICTE